MTLRWRRVQVSIYQEEIAEVYGSSEAGATTRHEYKGKDKSAQKIKRNDKHFEALGIEAPIKDYETLKKAADGKMV